MKEFQITAVVEFIRYRKTIHYCTVFDSSKITVEEAVAELNREEIGFSGYHIVSYKVIEI